VKAKIINILIVIVLLASFMYAFRSGISNFDGENDPFNISTIGAINKTITFPVSANVVNFTIQTRDYSDSHNDLIATYGGQISSVKTKGLIHVFRLHNEAKDNLTGLAFTSNDVLTNATGIRGVVNTALSNDGSEAQLNINDVIGEGYNEISICLWINTTQVATDATILTSRSGGTPFFLMDNSSDRWRIYVKGKNTNSMTFNNTPRIWNHVCYVSNATGTRIYHNGSIIYQDAENGTIEKHTGTTQLFNYQSAGRLNGTLAEFYIWNRTLTPDDVLKIYNERQGTVYPLNY